MNAMVALLCFTFGLSVRAYSSLKIRLEDRTRELRRPKLIVLRPQVRGRVRADQDRTVCLSVELSIGGVPVPFWKVSHNHTAQDMHGELGIGSVPAATGAGMHVRGEGARKSRRHDARQLLVRTAEI